MRNTLFLFALTLPLIGLGQTPSDTLSRFLEPAAVTAVRATERAPFAAETLDAEGIADRNTGQDLPYVLRYTPSVVVTSDAASSALTTAADAPLSAANRGIDVPSRFATATSLARAGSFESRVGHR